MAQLQLTRGDQNIQNLLNTHYTERDELLQRAQAVLAQDPRVSAAWLFGSLGRGDADELSDLDLFIIVADEHHEAIVADRYAYMAQLGEPLLILEAPQNWPPQAAYNMALYPGQSGPHQIDWYWQRQSAARIPTETQMLLDRGNLPHAEGPTRFDYAPIPQRPPEEVATQEVNTFWVMLLIAAKYVARTPWLAKMDLLKWPPVSLRAIEKFVGQPVSAITEVEQPQPRPADKLRILRECAARMETLMPQVIDHGGRVPAAIVPQAYLYLDFIEAIIPYRPNLVERI